MHASNQALAVEEWTVSLTVHGRLFQARMWREYARCFDGHRTANGIDRRWLETVGHVTREYCLRRARVNVLLARRLNRRKKS